MVSLDTVRELALALPDAEDRSEGDRIRYGVRDGDRMAWSYMRRVHPKKARVLDPECLAVRCLIERKEMLIEAAPDRFFDDDHYRGFPTVLVRLAAIEADELAGLLEGAWALSQPRPKPKRKR